MYICPVYATRFTIMFCYVSYHFFIYVEPFEFLIFHAVFTCCFIFSPNEGFLLFLLLSRDHGNFFSVCVCAYFVIYLMEWTLILDTRCDNNRVYSYFFLYSVAGGVVTVDATAQPFDFTFIISLASILYVFLSFYYCHLRLICLREMANNQSLILPT